MKIKKILAGISAIVMIYSTSICCFPEEVIKELSLHVSAEMSSKFVNTIPKYADDESQITKDGFVYELYDDEYDDDAITITGYNGTASNVVIPEKINNTDVVGIANEAFSNNKNITSINLGCIKYLGNNVFNGCTKLKELTIPQSITEAYCSLEGSSIETVTFEKGIENIPSFVCKGAGNLKKVIIHEKDDTIDGYAIGDSAFESTSISSIAFPKSLTNIGANAFNGCAYLTEIVIPDNVTDIGRGCFYDCKRMTSVTLGKGLKSMGSEMFANCVSLKEINIPQNVTEAYDCFAGSSIESVTFEKGIENIPECIFRNAENLKSVSIPEKEDTIDGYVVGDSAFENTKISSIELPKSLTGINYCAFKGCAYLTEIALPDNIISIGNECFSGCKRMTDIKIGKGVKELYSGIFTDCISLKSIDLSNVNYLGDNIFEGCTALKEIIIPKSVNSTGTCLGGSNIETVTFEDGIENIPAYVCKNAEKLKNVIIPEKKDIIDGYTIGECAFENTSISGITLPKSLTKIEDYAFNNCLFLTKVVIPDNVISIGYECFSDCKRLSDITMGKSVKEINGNAFKNCVSLTSINLANVNRLGESIFENCTKLKEIKIPKSVNEASNSLSDSSIEVITFDSGVKTVPYSIAKDCKNLRTVNLSDTVSVIGDYAFSGCSELSKINSNMKSFDFYAQSFENCVKLDDKRFTVFDNENTYLNSNSSLENVNGIVNYSLKYKLMPSIASNAEDMYLQLNIPEGMTLLSDSIQSKTIKLDPDYIGDGYIPVNKAEGELRFSARITEIGKYDVSALLGFRYNDSYWEQSIGRIDVECPDITISAPETVNEFSADVYGLANKGEKVVVYVNKTAAGEFIANEYTGKYSGTVKLPKGSDGDSYSLYAECGNVISETAKTVYSSGKPVVKKAILKYNENAEIDITDVLIQGTTPVINYNPADLLTFKITVTNNDKIDRLFITSTKGKTTKYIEAKYQEDSGIWIASGYFDNDNHSYVPGSLNVSIFESNNVIITDENLNSDTMILEDMPEELIEKSSQEVIAETDNAILFEQHVSNGTDINSFMAYSSQDDGMYIDNEYVTANEIAKNPQSYGFKRTNVEQSSDGTKYVYYSKIVSEKDSAYNITKTLRDVSSKIQADWNGVTVLKMVEGEYYDTIPCKLFNNYVQKNVKKVLNEATGGIYGDIGKALSVTSETAKLADRLALTYGNEELTVASWVLYSAKMFNTLGGTSAVFSAFGIVPPVSNVLSWLIGKGLSYAEDCLDKSIEENKQFLLGGNLKFIIDPSGLIYEAVIENPVENATVTIYYKDPDTGNAVIWNAGDYDQLNPLTTDNTGKYLWDVPEGQWKVVCEKEGYITSETEWMDIPPVRTDVNIAMVSKEAPVIESAEISGRRIIVKFSKFIDIKTVSSKSIIVSGYNGNYTVTPQLLSENDVYADTFILKGDFPSDVMNITITEEIKSYAGTSAVSDKKELVKIFYGDLNSDGEVNVADIVILQKFLTGQTTEILNNADLNGDRKVNIFDDIILRNMVLYK